MLKRRLLILYLVGTTAHFAAPFGSLNRIDPHNELELIHVKHMPHTSVFKNNKLSSMRISEYMCSMVHVPKVSVTDGRGEHKCRIYSPQGQYPASRGKGTRTLYMVHVRQFFVILMLRCYIQLAVTPKTLDLVTFVLITQAKLIALPLAHVCGVTGHPSTTLQLKEMNAHGQCS